MKTGLKLMAGVAVVLLLAADNKDDNLKQGAKKLQGTWTLVSGQMDGKKVPEEQIKASRIHYDGNEIVVETPHQTKEKIKATIKRLDTTKTPHEMDFVRSAGPNSGKTLLAIFEFIGDDQYRFCYDPSGKERPKDFSARAGSGHVTHVWKKASK